MLYICCWSYSFLIWKKIHWYNFHYINENFVSLSKKKKILISSFYQSYLFLFCYHFHFSGYWSYNSLCRLALYSGWFEYRGSTSEVPIYHRPFFLFWTLKIPFLFHSNSLIIESTSLENLFLKEKWIGSDWLFFEICRTVFTSVVDSHILSAFFLSAISNWRCVRQLSIKPLKICESQCDTHSFSLWYLSKAVNWSMDTSCALSCFCSLYTCIY